jgi:hypothetical protein
MHDGNSACVILAAASGRPPTRSSNYQVCKKPAKHLRNFEHDGEPRWLVLSASSSGGTTQHDTHQKVKKDMKKKDMSVCPSVPLSVHLGPIQQGI